MTFSLNEHYLNIAEEAKKQSTCTKLQVGAVLVQNGSVAAVGFNTAVKGLPTCAEAGHMLPNGRSREVHAEMSAIGQAAKNGVAIGGADIYITSSPCWDCFKMIATVGIQKIYFRDFHNDGSFVEAACTAGIHVEQLKKT